MRSTSTYVIEYSEALWEINTHKLYNSGHGSLREKVRNTETGYYA